MSRLIDFLTTGFCGLLNLSVPAFGHGHVRPPGFHFAAAGRFLATAFPQARDEVAAVAGSVLIRTARAKKPGK